MVVVGHPVAEELDHILRLIWRQVVARHHLKQDLLGPFDACTFDAPHKGEDVRLGALIELHEPDGHLDRIRDGLGLDGGVRGVKEALLGPLLGGADMVLLWLMAAAAQVAGAALAPLARV